MLLNIIIPYAYKDKYIDLQKSIDIQIGYCKEDVEIIIINDTKEFLDLPYKIYNTPKEKSGPGIARNLGIEVSNGDYILFMDNDNIFTDVFVFKNILDLIKQNDNENYIIFGNISQDDIGFYPSYHYTQGTVFNRKFLLNNNIKFLPQFRAEDMYFDSLVREYSGININHPIVVNRLYEHSIISINKEKDDLKEIHLDCMNKIFDRIKVKEYRDIVFTIHFIALLVLCFEENDLSIIDLNLINKWDVKINRNKLEEFLNNSKVIKHSIKIRNYINTNNL